jgi:hypothetical protein
MTTYYVGPGGDNGNAGTSWGARKLTLNGAEDIPVAAGDTVYVGPGTYREQLTVDVSGSGGSPITYIGDYTGANTDGVGGVVRITGSDNDQSATRATCITATSKTHRTFQGFLLDLTTGNLATFDAATNIIVEDCNFSRFQANLDALVFSGAGQASAIVRRCLFRCVQIGIKFVHTSTVDNAGHAIENCIFVGANNHMIRTDRIGGITVKNSTFLDCTAGVRVNTALTGGQTVTVNNCIFTKCNLGVGATATGELVEDYNAFHGNITDRTNVSTGSNSNTYPPLFDSRWFFEMVLGS